MLLADPKISAKQPRSADPIRLNLFFDLLYTLAKIRDFDSLGRSVGPQLRFVIDFEDCYFVLGDPQALPLGRVYLSTRSAAFQSPLNLTEPMQDALEDLLRQHAKVPGLQGDGKLLCLPLATAKAVLGVLIISRAKPFRHTDRQFMEAIGSFLAQMLEGFLIDEELTRSYSLLEQSAAQQKLLITKLEEERNIRARFVSALTHDLRTPLTAQVLIKQSGNDEAIGAGLPRIVGYVNRIDQMICDILDADRITAGEGIPIAAAKCVLGDLIASALNDLNRIYGNRFQVQIDTGCLGGYWDVSGLRRILENLATNAVKYGKPGTPITVRAICSTDWIELSVHNEIDGAPLSAEDKIRIFSPYGRTDSAIAGQQKGWGIGLNLVKGIAEAHSGTLRVESSGEHGTIFYVRLPLDARTGNPRGPLTERVNHETN